MADRHPLFQRQSTDDLFRAPILVDQRFDLLLALASQLLPSKRTEGLERYTAHSVED